MKFFLWFVDHLVGKKKDVSLCSSRKSDTSIWISSLTMRITFLVEWWHGTPLRELEENGKRVLQSEDK